MKKGFTLAEVLITMSIIAVVALLTLPSVIKTYKYKIYAATLKQTISQLEDAFKSSMADEHATIFIQSTGGVANDCTTGKESGPCYIFKNYLKVAVDCSGSLDLRCVSPNGYKSLKGDATRNWWDANKCAILNNGATVCMVYQDVGMYSLTHVGIDVNGPAEPNIIGIDLFTGRISANGDLIDYDSDASHCGTQQGNWSHVNDYSNGCLSKVIKNNWTITDD